jgi:SOS-response transcriptional repressor LexA
MKLVPENEEYEPIVLYPGDLEEVQISGKYVGHINEKGLHKA